MPKREKKQLQLGKQFVFKDGQKVEATEEDLRRVGLKAAAIFKSIETGQDWRVAK